MVAATFHRLVGDLEYPMSIVTARAADGEPLGCLIGRTSFHRAERIEAGHEA